MIPKEIIDQIRDTAKIEEVIGDYIPLRRRGANMIGLCPFHDERTPSFNVSPARGIFKCFGCGEAGDAIGFVRKFEKCSYPEAVKKVAQKYHIEVPEREMTEDEKQRQDDRESMFIVNEFCNKYYQNQLWDTSEGKMAGLGYLMQKRGLREDIIRRFQLGYSPERSQLAQALKNNAFNDKYTLNDPNTNIGTGVVGKKREGEYYDRFHGRVIFPFISWNGKVTGFAGRILVPKDNTGKYINSPTSSIYEKKHELYGFYQALKAIQKEKTCYLVEGQLDVISMAQAGIENVVSSGGTSLTVPQIRLIRRYTPNMTIIYDGDNAGEKASDRGIDMALREGMNVKLVPMPQGMDPDEFVRTHTQEEVKAYIRDNEVNFIRFKVASMQATLKKKNAEDDPNLRSELINSIITSISVIPDLITRQVYIKDTAALLGIGEHIIAKSVQQARRGEAEKEAKSLAQAQAQNPVKRTVLSPIEQNFRNLRQVLIRYGERVLYAEADGSLVKVGEYIIRQLQEDGVQVTDPILDRMIAEYEAYHNDEGFVAERFYRDHNDQEISQVAIDTIIQYSETNDQGDVLISLIPRLIFELKYTLVKMRLAELDQQLEEANNRGDWDAVRTILQQQPMLLEIRNQISRFLGNRVTD